MDCKTAKKLFVSYKDGDLEGNPQKALEKHFKQCEACRKDWDEYQRTLQEITGMHDLQPPADFVSKVKQTIGKRSRGRFFGETKQPSMVFAVVSFILILLFLLAYLVISHTTEIQIEPAKEEALTPTESENAPNNL